MLHGERDGLRTYRGAVAVVTGAASGIGLALSRDLVARGAHVVLADLDGERARAAAAAATGPGRAEGARLDVRDRAATRVLVEEAASRLGRLDYVFSNAGIGIHGEVAHYDPSDWDDVVDVNLKGTLHTIDAAYPLMCRQGFGHLVNTASVFGLMPGPGLAGYVATKHALVGLSLSLRIEAARMGVRVTALCPGAIRTPLLVGPRAAARRPPASPEELRLLVERYRPMDADAFARIALDRVARNPAVAVIPSWYRALWLLYRLFPRVMLSLQASDYGDTVRRLEKA